MTQEVLYRKWRPRRFVDVVGQDPVVTTLRNAVAHESPAHAYLFTGPRGTGKTSIGRILAKALNCPTDAQGEPLEGDPACLAYDEGRALDLIELDAASNRGIDEVRALRESVGYAPNEGRYKVYLIDEVHMLTDPAFNALLKTLEEPPPHVVFVLATTEPHRIPQTITSRCQRFDLRRITVDDIVARLRVIADGEGVQAEEEALRLVARQATGSLRDAINLLDQLIAFHGGALDLVSVQAGLGLVVDDRTRLLVRAALTGDLREGLTALAAARDDGLDIRAFMREVVGTLRQVLLLQAGAEPEGELSDAQTAELRALAEESTSVAVVEALRTFGQLDFGGDPYDSLPAEIAFAGLVTVAPSADTVSTSAAERASPAAPAATSSPPAPEAASSPARGATDRAAPRRGSGRSRPPADAPAIEAAEAGPASPVSPGPPPAPPPPPTPPVEPAEPSPPESSPPEPQSDAPIGDRATEAQADRDADAAPSPPDAPPAGDAPPIPDAAAPPLDREAPPAAAPSDTGDAGAETERLRGQWDRIREEVRRRSMRAGAMLNSGCEIKAFVPGAGGGDDTIELGFRFPKHVELVQSAENGAVLEAIRSVCSEALGRPVRVVPIVWDELQRAQSSAPSAPRGGGHLLDEARRLGAVPAGDAPEGEATGGDPTGDGA